VTISPGMLGAMRESRRRGSESGIVEACADVDGSDVDAAESCSGRILG